MSDQEKLEPEVEREIEEAARTAYWPGDGTGRTVDLVEFARAQRLAGRADQLAIEDLTLNELWEAQREEIASLRAQAERAEPKRKGKGGE
jgi:hypothetical protein